MKPMPISISDFKTIIDNDYFYIDKTLFMTKILVGKVILLPRPRRFGKTLNMSMLQYFYEKTEENNAYLFENLAIWQHEKYREKQGKYPVIFISMKDVKGDSWAKVYQEFITVISQEYERLEWLVDTEALKPRDKEKFLRIIDGTGTQSDYETSLQTLIKYLHSFHKKKVIVLFDEYDAPIHEAYYHGFYDQATEFLRQFMSKALKDYKNIEFSIVTGIMRTAKEGIFSGLNNLDVKSILNEDFSQDFGFTHEEVDLLLQDQNLMHMKDDIKAWYDGYIFGSTHMYNPWALLKCASERGELASHWGNTSNNNLIEKIIATAPTDVSDDLNKLLDGSSINEKISEGMIFPGMEKKSSAIWNLLLFTGYLTTKSYIGTTAEDKKYELIIPNKDVAIAFQERIVSIMENTLSDTKLKAFVAALFKGDAKLVGSLLHDFILYSASVRDFTADDIERSYHIFILGLLCCYQTSLRIWSNRESGYGYYDLAIIPRKQTIQPDDVGVVIELKTIDKEAKTEYLDAALEKSSILALEQIKDREYTTELVNFGLKRVIAYGIACSGKKVIANAQWVVGEKN